MADNHGKCGILKKIIILETLEQGLRNLPINKCQRFVLKQIGINFYSCRGDYFLIIIIIIIIIILFNEGNTYNGKLKNLWLSPKSHERLSLKS